MKPQKLSIVNGRRTTIGYDSRKQEYQTYNKNRWQYNAEYRDWETDRKSTRLNSSHITRPRMPSSA